MHRLQTDYEGIEEILTTLSQIISVKVVGALNKRTDCLQDRGVALRTRLITNPSVLIILRPCLGQFGGFIA